VPYNSLISKDLMIKTCDHENLKPYLHWAAKLKLGMHCKTTSELAELLSYGRNQSSINFIGLNIAKVGQKINLEMCPTMDPDFDWFAENWPFIAKNLDYRTYP
jgi:hypothetical protein